MKRVFSELSPEELCGLEVTLKNVGKRAAALVEQRVEERPSRRLTRAKSARS
jgi:hypothetical protein